MRVLITNYALDQRAGTELYVRDLASELLRRGQSPVVFSPVLGAVAAEIRAQAIAVVDDLELVAERPDIIHGQHNLTALAALIRFPDVPAVYVCHGWIPWQERPPVHPRIAQYVAVDQATRERLVSENGISPGAVTVLPNFVDLRRFGRRSPLPEKPERALFVNNAVTEASPVLRNIREACRRSGIQLDVVGTGVGRPASRIEEILPAYDLVFAKGRAAIEAAATGCAVIVANEEKLGNYVDSASLADLRALNFGIRTFRYEPTVEAAIERIGRYDPRDAAAVTEAIRSNATLASTVDRYLALYEAVLRRGVVSDAEAERRATVVFLQNLVRDLAAPYRSPLSALPRSVRTLLSRLPVIGRLFRAISGTLRAGRP